MDQTYQVLKRASEISKPGGGPVVRVVAPAGAGDEAPAARSPATPQRPSGGLAVAPQAISSSSGLPPSSAHSLLRSSRAVGNAAVAPQPIPAGATVALRRFSQVITRF